MSDNIILTDIKMEDNEVVICNKGLISEEDRNNYYKGFMNEEGKQIYYKDFVMTEGTDLLKQNIIRRLTTPRGSIFFNKEFGSEVYSWIKARDISLNYVEAHISMVLAECDEIKPYSINVEAYKNGSVLSITASFELWETKLKEKLSLYLSENDITANFAP